MPRVLLCILLIFESRKIQLDNGHEGFILDISTDRSAVTLGNLLQNIETDPMLTQCVRWRFFHTGRNAARSWVHGCYRFLVIHIRG